MVTVRQGEMPSRTWALLVPLMLVVAALGCRDPKNTVGQRRADTRKLVEADTSKLAEPEEGRGLILGRVTITVDESKEMSGTSSQPLIVYISHSNTEVIRVVADNRGYFAVGNVPVGQNYCVEKVECGGLTVPVSSTRSTLPGFG